jgi:hypothetical protein
MAEDALHDGRVFDRGENAQATAAHAGKNIDLENAAQEQSPCDRTTRG